MRPSSWNHKQQKATRLIDDNAKDPSVSSDLSPGLDLNLADEGTEAALGPRRHGSATTARMMDNDASISSVSSLELDPNLADENVEDCATWSGNQLRNELKSRGLPCCGTKQQKATCLMGDDAKDPSVSSDSSVELDPNLADEGTQAALDPTRHGSATAAADQQQKPP
jgi:hypothetical protein